MRGRFQVGALNLVAASLGAATFMGRKVAINNLVAASLRGRHIHRPAAVARSCDIGGDVVQPQQLVASRRLCRICHAREHQQPLLREENRLKPVKRSAASSRSRFAVSPASDSTTLSWSTRPNSGRRGSRDIVTNIDPPRE